MTKIFWIYFIDDDDIIAAGLTLQSPVYFAHSLPFDMLNNPKKFLIS